MESSPKVKFSIRPDGTLEFDGDADPEVISSILMEHRKIISGDKKTDWVQFSLAVIALAVITTTATNLIIFKPKTEQAQITGQH